MRHQKKTTNKKLLFNFTKSYSTPLNVLIFLPFQITHIIAKGAALHALGLLFPLLLSPNFAMPIDFAQHHIASQEN